MISPVHQKFHSSRGSFGSLPDTLAGRGAETVSSGLPSAPDCIAGKPGPREALPLLGPTSLALPIRQTGRLRLAGTIGAVSFISQLPAGACKRPLGCVQHSQLGMMEFADGKILFAGKSHD